MSGRMDAVVVALTGRIGTGIDALVKMLTRLGYEAVDADALARDLTRKGSPGYNQLLDRFGRQILDKTGEVDRPTLYREARTNPRARQDIRNILTPLVKERLRSFIQRATGQFVFIKTQSVDASGLRDLCDRVWLVTANGQNRIASLVGHHGWPQELAERFIRTESPTDPAVAQADEVLPNDSSRGALWNQLLSALRRIELQFGPGRQSNNIAIPGIAATAVSAASSNLVDELVGSPAPPPPAWTRLLAPPAPAGAKPVLSARAAKPSGYAEAPEITQLKAIGRRFLNSLFVLLAISFLTSWGLSLAENGRLHLPILPLQSIWQALIRTGQYLGAHPQTYYWARAHVPWLQLVGTTLGHSAGLLLLSMVVALVLGLPLGLAAAGARRKISSAAIMVISLLGASIPSFLFAMLLWVVNIWVYRTFDITVLPATGFGWDGHLLMPILVLAMRPLAQIAQVTYLTVHEALQQDYVRTAYSKGLAWRAVLNVHVLPNVLIPILNTLGSSLRFSLASLPVVEVFFHWPGVGLMLLDAIQLGNAPLVMDLILSLGLFFLFINLLIETCFPLIDPRLRPDSVTESRADKASFVDWLREAWSMLSGWALALRRSFTRRAEAAAPSPFPANSPPAARETVAVQPRAWRLAPLLRNPALIAGSVMLLLLVGLALFGQNLKGVNPYQIHGIMAIDGEYSAPPFKPSSIFPWGTDHIGRDIRSLVLAGAQRTLSLAFFGMLARLLLGGVLGMLAGWRRGGWLDRMVTGAMGIWAAFPATLFAMIVIQALGIQQGMWVFVVAISLVGWGEVAQFVRGQVITLKPQLFIESARSIGARADQILVRHMLPNLINPFIVLAALEMGGILMLLAELGFLNIFMGGGFRAMIGESGAMVPVVAFYSDVPEWSALIANVREHWRSYPWMALYPGLAVMLSILAFNLFGEGLRRFLDEAAVSLSRMFNRYTALAALGITVVVALVLRSAVPLSVYRAEGLRFDQQRVLEDIRILSAPQLQGRETGTPGADLAALYIARRFSEMGVFPAGEHNSYFQRLIQPRLHLRDLPTLTLLDQAGGVLQQFTYRQDFVEVSRFNQSRGQAQGRVMGVAYGPVLDTSSNTEFGLSNSPAMDHVIIIRAGDLSKIVAKSVRGVLVVADDASQLQRRDVYPYELTRSEDLRPYLLISPQVADMLLKSAGSSLAELDTARSSLAPGQIQLTPEGMPVGISLLAGDSENSLDEAYVNVLGVIPGQGHFVGMEDQVIVVSAYYDGVGTDLNGVVYPGANDNASGIATMLELARLLKGSTYQPDKSVLFVAWAGGERQEGLSIVNVLNARPGASELTVECVLELSGVGSGSGNSISIGSDSSYRLVRLFQAAASRYAVPTTTRGRGPHYDLPVHSIFGGRDAMTLSLSWDGSDQLAHTPADTAALIDPAKLRSVGRSAYLTLLVLSRETEY